jgi:hypothetical protein
MTAERKYFIDWVRVIAIGLLMIYHAAIGFQSWGVVIGFITNEKSWEGLWTPMTMLNVWRIPLLFFVSGMGVYFAMQTRNWKQLILDRIMRIWLPYIVGFFLIVPIHVYLWEYYNHFGLTYSPNPGHLWFLGNIITYVLICSPLCFYLKRNEGRALAKGIKWLMGNPAGLILTIASFIAEAYILNPTPYEMYAMTWHGFILGLLAFIFGFCFVFSGNSFWEMMQKGRWVFFTAAATLYAVRLLVFKLNAPVFMLVTESQCWIFSVFAWSSLYLNRSSSTLAYLSEAAYPVYILHMVFLYLGSILIFPLDIPVPIQFILVLVFTAAGCFTCYELISRMKVLRPLFGLKLKQRQGV